MPIILDKLFENSTKSEFLRGYSTECGNFCTWAPEDNFIVITDANIVVWVSFENKEDS